MIGNHGAAGLGTTRLSNCRRAVPEGVSGNPGGSQKELREVVDLARSHGPEAIETLAESPPAVRVAAASHILDRAYGKPKETVELRFAARIAWRCCGSPQSA
jgi:hypothetical protein